ncbi:MAG TPA: hypothetical protein VGH33_02015 [Isosphaeraceae bacterium]
MTPDAKDHAPIRLVPDEVRSALRDLYEELDVAVRARGPVCELSGRCCRFAEYDHTLFLSAPEAALLISDAGPPSRPLDDGATCPWQDAKGRCTARDARPLGCRIYYCDPAYQGAMSELGETYIARLKALVERLHLPWDYAPLHRHLRDAEVLGRLVAWPTEPRRQVADHAPI